MEFLSLYLKYRIGWILCRANVDRSHHPLKLTLYSKCSWLEASDYSGECLHVWDVPDVLPGTHGSYTSILGDGKCEHKSMVEIYMALTPDADGGLFGLFADRGSY